MKDKVQITSLLFIRIVLYIMDHADPEDPEYREIMSGIEAKLDALIRHDLYTKYKTADTLSEREQARLEYLDRVGVRSSFRW